MDKYSVFYRCSNCFETVKVWIPKKIEAPNYFACPKCGLATLNKTDKKYSPSVDQYDMRLEDATLVRAR